MKTNGQKKRQNKQEAQRKKQSRLSLFTRATENKDKFNFLTSTLDPQGDL